MLIHVKALNNPSLGEVQLEVSPSDTIQDVKSKLESRLNIPVQQQKLILKGKALHDGSLKDHQVVDGSKLHLVLSQPNPTKGSNDVLVEQLRLLSSKWTSNPQDRDAFANNFLAEMKKTVDRLSLDEIERLCTDRLNPTT